MTYPYGNAQEHQQADGSWTFTCQHGNDECVGNMYEACAIEHNKTVISGHPNWFPFFLCMEKSGKAGDTATAQKCAVDNYQDWNTISVTCAGSNPAVGTKEDGNPLMHNIAVATNSLIPPHTWTPWVVINGKPLSSAQLDESLTKLVCAAYTGTKPPGCNAFVSLNLDMADDMPEKEKY